MKGIISLCYRKVIDASSQKAWDKFVFDDTYLEFFMRAQYFDPQGKYTTLKALEENIPQAHQIHGMVSTAAIGYLQQLKDVMPEIVNAHGKLCLSFKRFKFEIIHSHIQNKTEHKVAIYFYSEPLTWIDSIGNHILVAYGNQTEAIKNGIDVATDIIDLQPNLSISFFQKTLTL